MDVTNGFTDSQDAAVAIDAALRSNVGGPFSDAAVLAAIGSALVRYYSGKAGAVP